MNIDNKVKAAKIKLIYLLFPFILVIGTALFFLLSEKVDVWYIVYAVMILLAYFILMGYFKFNYVSFYAGPDKIRVRYKSLSPFNSPNKSIEIKVENFYNYETKQNKKGSVKTLSLLQHSPGGIAKYPPISLTAVDQSEIDKIIKSLKLILAMKKSQKG